MTKDRRTSPRSFVSLFSGCGGLDLGFEQSGFSCIAAFDSDPQVLKSHKKNLSAPTHVTDLSATELLKLCPPASLVLAGPPCQGFSTAGKRNLHDPRNSLLVAAAEIAMKIRPAVFVLENVVGVTAGEHRVFWDRVEALVRLHGYKSATLTCRGHELGLAQLRTRKVLIAWNTGKDITLSMPNLPPVTLRDVLAGIENVPDHAPKYLDSQSEVAQIAKRIQPGQKLSNVRLGERAIQTWQIPEVFGRVSHSESEILRAVAVLRRRERLRAFGDADPVKQISISKLLGRDVSQDLSRLLKTKFLRKIGHRYDLIHTFNGKFRRLDWDQPAFTVDTRFGEPRYFLHPAEQRGFSVREAARIQGFPDGFLFEGTERQRFRMIGNAVPPPMASQIANLILEAILA
jgi:DNA (cytosine-5)-methyltransferase 1